MTTAKQEQCRRIPLDGSFEERFELPERFLQKVFCPVCTACFALSGPQKEDLSRYVSSLAIFANNLLNAQSHVRISLLSPLALIRDLHPFSVSLIKTTAFMTFLGEYKHFESPRTDHAHKTNRF